jgi:hypothetical protein
MSEAYSAKNLPKDYDGFYFLPPDDENLVGLQFQFFKFKDEYKGGTPIESSSVGDKFHVAFFRKNENGEPEFDDSFEGIFADPVVYVQNLMGTDIYGCFCRKTDKSEKWFVDYLTKTTKSVTIRKMVKALQSVVNSK